MALCITVFLFFLSQRFRSFHGFFEHDGSLPAKLDEGIRKAPYRPFAKYGAFVVFYMLLLALTGGFSNCSATSYIPLGLFLVSVLLLLPLNNAPSNHAPRVEDGL